MQDFRQVLSLCLLRWFGSESVRRDTEDNLEKMQQEQVLKELSLPSV